MTKKPSVRAAVFIEWQIGGVRLKTVSAVSLCD